MRYFTINENKNRLNIVCKGDWDKINANLIEKDIFLLKKRLNNYNFISFDLKDINNFDTIGIVLFYEIVHYCDSHIELKIEYKNNLQKRLALQAKKATENKKIIKTTKYPKNLFEESGKYTIDFLKDFWFFLLFIGESSTSFVGYLLHPSKIRWTSIIKSIENAGVRALPIVLLTSFLVGVVVAYQSAVQLQKFGANIFIVDMISISITRELSPLITAIVVAGRSGSSYTAQIGAMKITRELDAMKTMGFNLFEFLVLPRTIALMIAMPLMIFFADMIGIFGGMVVSKFQMDISYVEFIKRLHIVLQTKQLWIGLIKGPVFAILIASVGCFRGFQVSNNTESIGKYTTMSVVNSIFLVIACDALFSVILTKLGV